MIPAQLSGFFAASTAAAAALVGLLFVAISIAPQRVFGTTAAPHAIATSAFIALADALFISFGALISPGTCSWIALAMGVVGLVGTLAQAYTLLYLELNPRLVAVRSVLVIAALVIYAVQCWYASQILLQPNASWPAYGLANVLLAVFALGILRAYGLLGAHVTGLRAWLGPRRYTPDLPPEPEAELARALDAMDTDDHTR
jgi:hypothetical protein